MSSLWRNNKLMILLTMQNRPSPKHKMIFSGLARGQQFILKICSSIKGTSLPAFLKKGVCAGMTVEASLLLPLFIFLFVNLGSAIEMIRLHGNLQLALWDVGRRLSVYEYVINGEGNSRLWQEFKDVAVTYTYVKGELINYVGEHYLEQSPITYGADGLQFWESEVFTEDDEIEIIVTYNVSSMLPQAGFYPFRMANRYYARAWTGYDIMNADAIHRDIVYVAENGEVYHEERNCTHLLLSVKETSMEQALLSRNRYGSRYVACEKCVRGPRDDTVFITDEGDCYHYERYCSGIKRTVYEMERERAQKYRPCGRCSSVR